jgi:hypothetical protein
MNERQGPTIQFSFREKSRESAQISLRRHEPINVPGRFLELTDKPSIVGFAQLFASFRDLFLLHLDLMLLQCDLFLSEMSRIAAADAMPQ